MRVLVSSAQGANGGGYGTILAFDPAANRYRRPMQFSPELRDHVLAGDITVSIRLWQRPKVRVGGRYPVGPGVIEVESIERLPFAHVTATDVRRSGEPDRETLRQRAGHAGPIGDDTLVYRIAFHLVDEGRA